MRTLVLNAGYEPLAVVSDRRALVLVMTGKANILEREVEHPVFGISGLWDRPTVIILSRYVRVPMAAGVPLTRRGVLRTPSTTSNQSRGAVPTVGKISSPAASVATTKKRIEPFEKSAGTSRNLRNNHTVPPG